MNLHGGWDQLRLLALALVIGLFERLVGHVVQILRSLVVGLVAGTLQLDEADLLRVPQFVDFELHGDYLLGRQRGVGLRKIPVLWNVHRQLL